MKTTFDAIEKRYDVKFPTHDGEVYCVAEDAFEYYYGTKGQYGGPWVTIKKNTNGKWYYERLNKVSESEQFDEIQECIDAAYRDMSYSKY